MCAENEHSTNMLRNAIDIACMQLRTIDRTVGKGSTLCVLQETEVLVKRYITPSMKDEDLWKRVYQRLTRDRDTGGPT